MIKINDNFKNMDLPDFYKSVINSITDALVVVEHESGKIAYVNDVFLKLFDYSENEISGLFFKDLHPKDFFKFANEEFQKGGKSERNLKEVPCVRKNGDIFKCNVRDNTFEFEGKKFSIALFTEVKLDSELAKQFSAKVDKIKLWMQQISTGVVYQNSDGVILTANKAAERILGLTLEQMQGRTSVDKRWHAIKDDGSPFDGEEHPAMQALATKQNVENMKMGVYNPRTFGYNWIKINALLDYSENDKTPAGVYTFFEDISEDEQYLQNLLITNDLFAQGPVVIFKWSLGTDYPVEFVSSNVEELLGYQPNEFYISAVKFRDIIHPEDMEIVEREVIKASESKQHFIKHSSYRLRKKDGTYITINDHTRIVYNSNGDAVNFIGYIYDISELLENEEKLKTLLQEFEWQNWELKSTQNELYESEKRWKFALEGSNSGVWDWNLKTDEVFYSLRWKTMLGYNDDEISDSITEWDRLIHPDDRSTTYLNINDHIYGKTEYYENEHRMRCKSGEYIWVLDRGKVIERDENNKALRMIGTHTDISDRKRNEEFKHSLAALIENSSDIIVIKDLNLRVVATNQAFAKAAGKKFVEQLIGKTDAEIFGVSPETEPVKSYIKDELYAQKLKKGEFIEREEPVFSPDGSVKYVITRKFPVYDKQNKLIGTANISTDISGRKEIEAQLKESQNILTMAMESTNSAIWNLNIQSGKFHLVGEKIWKKIFGYTFDDFEEINFNTWHSLIHPEDAENTLMQFQFTAYGATDAMYDEEYRMKHKSGEWIWVNVRGRVNSRDAEGNPLLMQGTLHDISERKAIEQKLRASEENFRSFFETMENMIFVAKKDGSILYTNNEVKRKLQYSSNEILKMNLVDLRSKYNFEEAMQSFEEILEGTRNHCDLPLESKDGSLIPVESKLWFGKWNNQEVIYCLSKDISDLRAAHDKYNKLFDNNPALMAVTLLPERKFTEVNSTFINTLGYSRKELIGKTAFELGLYHDKMQLLDLNRELAKNNKVINHKLTVQAKDGRLVYGIFSGEIIELQGNEYFLSVMTDISELHKIETALQESEEKFRKVGTSALDGIIIMNEKGYAEYVNPAAERMFGYSAEELQSNFIHDLIMPKRYAEKFKLGWSKYIGTGEGYAIGRVIDLMGQHKSGKEISIEVALSAMKFKDKFWTVAFIREIAERKEIQYQLNEASERLRLATRAAEIGIWDLDIRNNELKWDEQMFKLYGVRPEDFSNAYSAWQQCVHPDDLAASDRAVQQAIRGEKELNIEFRVVHPDGSIRNIRALAAVINSEEGIPERIIGTNWDITEQKHAEKLLRESEEKYRAMFEESSDAYLIIKDDIIIDCNNAAAEILSTGRENIIGKSPSDLSPAYQANGETSFDAARARTRETYKSGHSRFEWLHRRFDGTDVWVEVYLNVFNLNGEDLIFTTWRNINDRKNAEEALKRSEEKYRQIAENMSDMVWTTDMNLNTTYVSPTVEKLYGTSAEEYLTRKIDEVFPVSSIKKMHKIIQEELAKEKDLSIPKNRSRIVELMQYRADKSLMHVSMNIKFIRDEYEIPIGMQGVTRDITQLKQAEERVELLANMTDISPNSIMLHDTKGKILYANHRASEMHGYSYEEFLQLNISDIDVPDDYKLFQQRINDIETKGEAVFEVQHYRKDGSTFPLEVFVKKVNWNEQEVVLSVSTDISERKKAEKEFMNIQEQYKLAVQGSNDGIWDWDIKNNTLFLSEKWKEMMGYKDIELENNFGTFEKLLHPDDKEMVFAALDKYFNSNRKIYEVEFRFRHKKGHYLWILARGQALRDKDGKPYRMAGSHSDITSRKIAEESLKRYAEMHKLLTNIASKYINMPLNEVHDSIQKSLEEMGRFVNADRAYLFDYDWENQVTNNTYEWCEEGITPQIDELQGIPLEMMTEWLESHTKGETMYIPSVQELPEGDTVREILEPQEIKSLIAVPMMHGKLCIGFAGFDSVKKYHNYTENELKILDLFTQMLVNIRMRTEGEVALIEAKREAESANKAKSEFLANISHEIRTPMNAILGFSEVMLNTVQSNQQRSYLKTILNSGKTLLSLINDILDLSKIEAGRLEISPEPIDIQVVLHEIGQIFAQKLEEKGLDYIIDIADNFPPSITIDEVRFRQILLNIVGNAIKFTDYGYIKLKLRVLSENSGIIAFSIDVEDSGIGINKEDQAKIFESFSQKSGQDSKKYGGTGLGLAISRRLCELMNGEITLESEEGRGSTFTITFYDIKYSDDVVEHKDEFSWNEEEIIFENLKILVVDDVPSNRDLVLSYLNNYNLTCYEAENGRVAVESTLAFKPDLVFMDIRMPGMTGYEATEIIKTDENTKDIPIVALTASTMRSETETILKLFDGYLRKPIQKKSLINEMCRHLPFQKIEKAPENKNVGEIDEIFNDMPEMEAKKIKSILKKDFINKIDNLILMMNVDEISEFSNKLIVFANSENISILQKFNEKLTQAIAGFEFEEIEELLESLRKIVNK